jgi:hypothetical protein
LSSVVSRDLPMPALPVTSTMRPRRLVARSSTTRRAREFFLAADHRRAQTGDAAYAPGRRARRQGFKDFDRLDPILNADRTEFAKFKERLGRFVHGAADENRAGLGDALQARRDIHRIAERGVLHSQIGADAADDDRAGMQPDSHAQRNAQARFEIGVDALERGLHPERGAHRACRIVLVRNRRAEECHDPVAQHFVNRSFVFVDFAGECFERAVNEIVNLFGIEFFGDGGKAADVGEENGDVAAFPFDLFADRGNFLRECVGDRRGDVGTRIRSGHARRRWT